MYKILIGLLRYGIHMHSLCKKKVLFLFLLSIYFFKLVLPIQMYQVDFGLAREDQNLLHALYKKINFYNFYFFWVLCHF